ncbi:hypothetical protein V8D89_008817 [Ganoderma adspersum]
MACPAFPHSTAAVTPPTLSEPHNTAPPSNFFLHLAEPLPDRDANSHATPIVPTSSGTLNPPHPKSRDYLVEPQRHNQAERRILFTSGSPALRPNLADCGMPEPHPPLYDHVHHVHHVHRVQRLLHAHLTPFYLATIGWVSPGPSIPPRTPSWPRRPSSMFPSGRSPSHDCCRRRLLSLHHRLGPSTGSSPSRSPSRACVLREEELRRPSTPDADGERSLPAIKAGTSTGVTFGRANGFFSFVREPEYREDSAFSDQCDSGSVIVHGRARIVGLLTGSAGLIRRGSTDVMYATPFYRLLGRVKTHLPDVCFHQVAV